MPCVTSLLSSSSSSLLFSLPQRFLCPSLPLSSSFKLYNRNEALSDADIAPAASPFLRLVSRASVTLFSLDELEIVTFNETVSEIFTAKEQKTLMGQLYERISLSMNA